MARFLSKHALDIVFLVLVFAAALTIFLLSRADRSSGAFAAEPAQTSATPTARAPEKTPARSFRGVPEDVFVTHLRCADAYDAEIDDSAERLWTIDLGEPEFLKARLSYTLDGGAISSVSLWLPLPGKITPQKGSSLERAVEKTREELSYAQADAIRALLADLLPACDLDGALTAADARAWAEGAIAARAESKTYRCEGAGCQFLAYRSMKNDGYELCMALYAGS